MENQKFDEDLNNYIKQIFEDYDDDGANQGWNLLREKYPEKNNRKYFSWWMAAAVLLIVALLVWFSQPETEQAKSTKFSKQTKVDSNKIQVKANSFSKNLKVKKESPDTNHFKKAVLKTASTFYSNHQSSHKKTAFYKDPKITQSSNPVFTDTKTSLTDTIKNTNPTSDFVKADTTHIEKSSAIVQTQNLSVKPLAKKEVVKTAFAKKTVQKISRFGLSLYAGLHLNFANGSNTSLGFGVGIFAEFVLNKKLKLATGLGLIQNKLSYQTNTNNNLYASIPAYQNSTVITGSIINNATLNGFNASLLQLDVPINLIYQILPGKNSIAILAGLSSGTFVKENYQYNYVNPANDLKSSKSFQSFYLLKTLNMAVQFELPIKKYSLQVEPFVKVPLGNLSTQQSKFGAAGINLKFNF